MTDHIKGKPLRDFNDNEPFYQGNIFRLFGVERYDVMKLSNDRLDQNKIEKDFYDLMLVDLNAIMENSFILVNVTPGSDNKGKIFALIEGIETRNFITASVLKSYFTNHDNLYLVKI